MGAGGSRRGCGVSGGGAEAAPAVFVRPTWAQAHVLKAITGMPAHVVRGLVNSHRVRAKKVDPSAANSVTVYCVRDVEEWLENDAADAGPFKVPARGGAECAV